MLDDKQIDESSISITSVASCLQVLTQCHDSINEDISSTFVDLKILNNQMPLSFLFILFISSSDSDSDPEGGELPNISY